MQDQSRAQVLKPVAVAKDEGEARWWFGSLAVIKATAADTGGQLTIVEVTEAPGAEAPLHVHHREDEAFYILEGSATIHVGDESFEVGPGDYAFGPRDPTPLHDRRQGLPDALHLYPRRVREPRPADERPRGAPHAAAPLRRGARLGARRRRREGQRL